MSTLGLASEAQDKYYEVPPWTFIMIFYFYCSIPCYCFKSIHLFVCHVGTCSRQMPACLSSCSPFYCQWQASTCTYSDAVSMSISYNPQNDVYVCKIVTQAQSSCMCIVQAHCTVQWGLHYTFMSWTCTALCQDLCSAKTPEPGPARAWIHSNKICGYNKVC
jgi:hypothetical protein